MARRGGLFWVSPTRPTRTSTSRGCTGRARVGAVALSPFIKPGTTSRVDYNHYSLLKTVEEIFGLPLLGDARQRQVKAFSTDVFAG